MSTAGIRHDDRVEQDAHRGAVRVGLAVAGAAQLLGVGAGERGVRVEVLALEHAGVAAAETLQVGLSGPAHRHVGTCGDENRCRGADSVQSGTRAGGVGVRGELATRPRGTQRLDDAVLPVHRVGVDGQAAAVVGDADRPVGVQGDRHGGPAVAGIGDLFDRVVHDLAQRGVEHVEARGSPPAAGGCAGHRRVR